ncbi:hypothetical protein [Mycolicibacterium peregrinum]|uniref:hypothetical protein n=1 Tax=Mycolicibacterium peregrinum TaxID=43304 RepID=UPI003AAB16DE
MDVIINLLGGFWTWQTPVSFLAGIGAGHIYTKYIRDREGPMMFRKKADGTCGFSVRFWVYTAVATMLIVFIGVRTQVAADRAEDALAASKQQAASATAYSAATNACLAEVISVLTTRVGYNDRIADLDQRRQSVWEALVDDLAKGGNDDGLNMEALKRFYAANQTIKNDQAKLAQQREQVQYPRCTPLLPPK